MVIAATASSALAGGGYIANAVKSLYGVTGDLNDFLDRHVEEMKQQPNALIARTGRVLEAAKCGFGLGYLSSTIVIATGQILLGNVLSAAVTVATAATLTNPIAMTCAAVGAVYYGWNALSERERNEILDKLSQGLAIGLELIKAVVRFVVETTKDLLSSKNIEDIKQFVSQGAAVFGRTLGDVTHRMADIVGEAFGAVRQKAGAALDMTVDAASDAYVVVSEGAVSVAQQVRIKVSGDGQTPATSSEPYVPVSDREHVATAVTSEKLNVTEAAHAPSLGSMHSAIERK